MRHLSVGCRPFELLVMRLVLTKYYEAGVRVGRSQRVLDRAAVHRAVELSWDSIQNQYFTKSLFTSIQQRSSHTCPCEQRLWKHFILQHKEKVRIFIQHLRNWKHWTLRVYSILKSEKLQTKLKYLWEYLGRPLFLIIYIYLQNTVGSFHLLIYFILEENIKQFSKEALKDI